jgi:hypothetical protein
MPISFGSNDSAGAGNYVRANLPQNRWTVNKGGDPEVIDMAKGIAIDIANVKFGWLKIAVGTRDWQEWPSPSQPAPKPTETDADGKPAYKQGFDVDCWMADGTKAHFSNNSYGTGQFIAKLYNQAENAPEFAQGMVPVVSVTTSTPVVVGKGTSYDLGFTISKWIDKPAEDAAPAPAPVAAAPAPAPASAPAAPADNNFGF